MYSDRCIQQCSPVCLQITASMLYLNVKRLDTPNYISNFLIYFFLPGSVAKAHNLICPES